MRKLPIFTFINKMDRPALEPLELLDEIEKEFDLSLHAVNWPIGSGDRFVFWFIEFNTRVYFINCEIVVRLAAFIYVLYFSCISLCTYA